jgi:hypothetical protein
MPVTVIIAHYAPQKNGLKYRSLLKQTITSIKEQNGVSDVEIILCDDGSYWSKNIVNNDGSIREISGSGLSSISELNELDIDLYLGLPDINKYRSIILKHRAFELSKYDKIICLDDDHPFIRKDSLKLYNDYLERYEFVRGRVIGPWGRPQLFLSRNAQGPNIGLQKGLYFKIGGYGKYLFDNGYGEDNDILWKIYAELSKTKTKKTCWAGEIVTKDLATDRWADRSFSDIKIIENNKYKRQTSFVIDFKNNYGVHPYKNNPATKKHLWVKFGSWRSILSEIKYLGIYIIYIPKIFFYFLKRVINRIKRMMND